MTLLQRACDLRPVTSSLGLFFNISRLGQSRFTTWLLLAYISQITESQRLAKWLTAEGICFFLSFFPSSIHWLASWLNQYTWLRIYRGLCSRQWEQIWISCFWLAYSHPQQNQKQAMFTIDWISSTSGSEYSGSASVILSAPRLREGGEPQWNGMEKELTLGVKGLGSGTSSGSNCCVTLGKSISISSCQFPLLENREMGMIIPVLSC